MPIMEMIITPHESYPEILRFGVIPSSAFIKSRPPPRLSPLDRLQSEAGFINIKYSSFNSLAVQTVDRILSFQLCGISTNPILLIPPELVT
jgi:hypothetical protein